MVTYVSIATAQLLSFNTLDRKRKTNLVLIFFVIPLLFQMSDNIQDLLFPGEDTLLDKSAADAEEKSKIGVIGPNERTLLVLGSRGVGKTSLIVEAFSLKEEITPTLALEYFFSTEFSEYDYRVCNIWELGGGTTFSPTLYAIENMPNMTAILMLDLSFPPALFHTAESSIQIINGYIEKRDDAKELKKKAMDSIPDDHPDKNLLTPCPIPLVIIGGKYDRFQEFEPEQKRAITVFLRFVAHTYHAYLFFYSNKNNNLMKVSKDLLNHFAFRHEFNEKTQMDYSLPVYIPPGGDSYKAIDANEAPPYSIEKYKTLLESRFPQNLKDRKQPDNPKYDISYKEPKIDNMRAEKDEVLERLCQEIELELKLTGKVS